LIFFTYPTALRGLIYHPSARQVCRCA
jgi:hypothetical protein